MLPLWTTVLLTLSAVPAHVSGAHSSQYRRKNPRFAGSPSSSVSANSAIQCGLRCTATEAPFCDGFTYLADGTCQLYADPNFCEVSEPAQSEEGAGGTGSFRRRDTEACPGERAGDSVFEHRYCSSFLTSYMYRFLS